jgi:dienelactone hydrolase
MKTSSFLLRPLVLLFVISLLSRYAAAQPAPNGQVAMKDHVPKNTDTPRDFPVITSRDQWQQRAKKIRQHILISCGLWPLPPRCPLDAHISGRIERDGYSVERVYFQSLPGFYVGGNLYRPLGKGKGPFPAVLNPHGHWDLGRLADTKDGSIPARCISFARQGMLAFSYDMVGFNDTHFPDTPQHVPFYQVHRMFATNRTDMLWNISLMGLQTWDSIRALDFLESLPEADRHRLACTGESGGGTQTFMLGAVDDRLAVQAPVVMVSHIMQGGCSCENAPGLRVEYSNMEIAATPAPRPQILVAATGDWTKDTPKVEGPAIAHIYDLFNAQRRFRYVQFDFGHNYNQTSREAVYEWFGQWLPRHPAAVPFKEPPCQKEPDADLRVFADGQLPPGALTQTEFIESLRRMHRAQWEESVPHDRPGLKRFEKLLLPAWQHTLQVDDIRQNAVTKSEKLATGGDFVAASVSVTRSGENVPILGSYWAPRDVLSKPKLVVLVNPDPENLQQESNPGRTPEAFLRQGFAVLRINRFTSTEPSDQFENFYCTYNRTTVQSRVRDLLTICSAADRMDPRGPKSFRVVLVGAGEAGLWALLAAPGADAVAADVIGLDWSDEQALLAPRLFCPGLLTIGGFAGGAMLAPSHPLLLHDTGNKFATADLLAAYTAAGTVNQLKVENSRQDEDAIVRWVAQIR